MTTNPIYLLILLSLYLQSVNTLSCRAPINGQWVNVEWWAFFAVQGDAPRNGRYYLASKVTNQPTNIKGMGTNVQVDGETITPSLLFEQHIAPSIDDMDDNTNVYQFWYHDALGGGQDAIEPTPNNQYQFVHSHQKYLISENHDHTGFIIQHSIDFPVTKNREDDDDDEEGISDFLEVDLTKIFASKVRNVHSQHAFCFNFLANQKLDFLNMFERTYPLFHFSNLPVYLYANPTLPYFGFELHARLTNRNNGNQNTLNAQACRALWDANLQGIPDNYNRNTHLLSNAYIPTGEQNGEAAAEDARLQGLDNQQQQQARQNAITNTPANPCYTSINIVIGQTPMKFLTFDLLNRQASPHCSLQGHPSSDPPYRNSFFNQHVCLDYQRAHMINSKCSFDNIGSLDPWYIASKVIEHPLVVSTDKSQGNPAFPSVVPSVTNDDVSGVYMLSAWNYNGLSRSKHEKLAFSVNSDHVCFGDSNTGKDQLHHFGIIICFSDNPLAEMFKGMARGGEVDMDNAHYLGNFHIANQNIVQSGVTQGAAWTGPIRSVQRLATNKLRPFGIQTVITDAEDLTQQDVMCNRGRSYYWVRNTPPNTPVWNLHINNDQNRCLYDTYHVCSDSNGSGKILGKRKSIKEEIDYNKQGDESTTRTGRTTKRVVRLSTLI